MIAARSVKSHRLLLTASEQLALAFLQDKGTATGAIRLALRWLARYQPKKLRLMRLEVLSLPDKAKRYGREEYGLEQMLWRVRSNDIAAIKTIKGVYRLPTTMAAVRLAIRALAMRKGFTLPVSVW